MLCFYLPMALDELGSGNDLTDPVCNTRPYVALAIL